MERLTVRTMFRLLLLEQPVLVCTVCLGIVIIQIKDVYMYVLFVSKIYQGLIKMQSGVTSCVRLSKRRKKIVAHPLPS